MIVLQELIRSIGHKLTRSGDLVCIARRYERATALSPISVSVAETAAQAA
jgi:hypothetical protein